MKPQAIRLTREFDNTWRLELGHRFEPENAWLALPSQAEVVLKILAQVPVSHLMLDASGLPLLDAPGGQVFTWLYQQLAQRYSSLTVLYPNETLFEG